MAEEKAPAARRGRPRKTTDDATTVELDAPEVDEADEVELADTFFVTLPVQHDADPQGDTPAQMRV